MSKLLLVTSALLWMVAFQVFAQPVSPPESMEPANAGKAYLRCFADLGERQGKVTYSLSFTNPQAKPGEGPAIIFERLNGGFSSNIGSGAMPLPPGIYRFTLQTDGGATKDSISENLKAGAMYSLLATLDGERPVLRLVQESPLGEEEQPGVVIHNLKTDTPLFLAVAEQTPIRVPPSKTTSFFFASDKINGSLVALYSSERKTTRRRSIDYGNGQRLVVVFMRNGYGQSTIFSFPSKPEE